MNLDLLNDSFEDKNFEISENKNPDSEIEDSEIKWFTIHVYSGSEKKVEKMISELRENADLGKFIYEIYIPIKKSSKVVRSSKSAKRVVKPKNLYPGYIFIKMKPDKEVINKITDLPNVISFLGGKNPIPLKSLEEGELKQLREEGDKIVKLTAPFAVNDSVKIVSGPFSDFIGVVENVNEEKQRLKIVVTVFGRSTPVEVDFIDAQPV